MKLWDHQIKTVDFYTSCQRAYNASDPGTGKTIATLEYAFKNNLRTLILAPKTLLETAWLADWKKFDTYPDVDVAWANNRRKVFASGVPNVITNIEAVNFLRNNPQFITKFDLVVCDEATAFKNPTAIRSKNAKVVFERIPRAIIMSGTPLSKSVRDLWLQYYLLDGGARLGQSFTRFKYEFCKPTRPFGAPPGAVKWEDKPDSSTRISELVADITIRYKRDECMDIPDNLTHYMEYTPDAPTRKAYAQMLKEAVIQLDSGEILEAVNAAVARNKLLQVLTGALYRQDGSTVSISKQRTDIIVDLIEERDASVVFFLWRHQKEALEQACKKRGIEVAFIDGTVSNTKRAEIVADFQAGKYRAIMLHPETGAHGITLTRAKTAIFTTPPGDRPDWLTQGIARIVRGGQTEKTETIFVCAKDSLEKKVYSSISNQKNVGDAFINYLQSLRG